MSNKSFDLSKKKEIGVRNGCRVLVFMERPYGDGSQRKTENWIHLKQFVAEY